MEITLVLRKIVYTFGLLYVLLSFITATGQLHHRRKYRTTLTISSNKFVTVYRGYTTILECSVENLGPRAVAWRKVTDDFPLSVGKMMYAPNEEMSIDYQQIGHVTHIDLVIKRTKPSHAGTYECQLIGTEAKLHHVTLTVLKEPPVPTPSISLDGSVYLSPKQRLNLTCNATGTMRAPESIDWFHNGILIEERKAQWQNRTLIYNRIPEVPGLSLISQLTIEHAKTEDAGVYVCRSMTPWTDTGVETTSIIVHILNAEKDHVKKRNEAKSVKYDNNNGSLTVVQEQDYPKRNMGLKKQFSLPIFSIMTLVSLIIR